MEMVITVDKNDNEIGVLEKMEAHQKGVLHRAFSVFLFNNHGQLLLQRRAESKYHSPLLWTNTCCSHPRPGESVIDAASRRLIEEMGIQVDVVPVFEVVYNLDMGNGLTEHEYDHVLFGFYEGVPKLNPNEVADFTYISVPALLKSVKKQPKFYTEWFKYILSINTVANKLHNPFGIGQSLRQAIG